MRLGLAESGGRLFAGTTAAAEELIRVIYLLVGIASLGGVLFGYETGVAAGALHLASNGWARDALYYPVLLSSGTLIGAMVGALLSGKLADIIGRRDVIMATAALFTLGAFVSAIAPSIYVLLLARFIVGIAVGAMSVAAPLYIAEISPAAKRGVLVCFFELAIATGFVLAYLGNEIFSSWPNGWRYMLAMGAIPGILLSVLALLLLESPFWLALQGDEEEARSTLARLNESRFDSELEPVVAAVSGTEREQFRDLFSLAGRRALFLCVGIFFFQQFVGINTILYYGPSSSTGHLDLAEGKALTFVVLKFFVTLLAVALVDRVGRRPLLLASLLGMSVGLFLVAGGLGLTPSGDSVGQLTATVGLFLFIGFFAVGMGPIAWVTVSEVCPPHIRGFAMSIAVASHWLFDGLASPTSFILTNELGRTLIFAFYGTVALAGFFVFQKIFPENKGMTLLAIHQKFADWADKVQDSRFVHYTVTTLVATGGMLTGFNLAISASTLLLVTAEWNLDPTQQGMLVSSILVGLIFGCLIHGPMCDRFGRRYVLMSTAALFVGGAFGCALAPSLGWLVAARVAVGVAVGITAPTTGIYVAEIAPTAIRGRLLSFDAVTYGVGVLMAYVVSLVFEAQPDGWRYMFAFVAVPSTIYGLALLPLPESPRWLVAIGRRSAARRVFLRLNEHDVNQLVGGMNTKSEETETKAWAKLAAPLHRPALTLGLVLMFLHVFSGWDMVLFYGPTVLKETGFEGMTVSFVTTLGLGMVFLVLTIISLFIVDKIGRRPLAVSGLSVMAGCLCLMAAMTVASNTMNPATRWALVACLAMFVAAFALTLNTVSDVIISEIYPQAIRGPASSLCHTMRSLFSFIFSFCFPLVLAFVGLSLTFLLFAAFSAVGALYLWRQLPETRGQSLEEIADYWRFRSGEKP
jgi:sugar porter (SP) family MFS transporter